jgi:hypothetical protein
MDNMLRLMNSERTNRWALCRAASTHQEAPMPKYLTCRRWTCAAGLLFAAWWPSAGHAEPNTNTITCTLEQAGAEHRGSCEIPCLVNALAINIDGPKAGASCTEPPRRVAAALGVAQANGNRLGTMQGRQPEDPTRFELVAARNGQAGVAKTPFGWFRLGSAQQDGDRLSVTIFANQQLPPTADDIRIIERAMALVSDVAVWNKADDRNCLPNPQKWSVFCALMQATEEISGGIHYRQPALQVVREVVNEVGGTRVGKHRLMDYNNHPDTTLDDIHAMLKTAKTRLQQRFR